MPSPRALVGTRNPDPAETSVRPPTTISPRSGARGRDAAQGRRLPAAGGAEQREELALAHRERHAVDRDDMPDILAPPGDERLRQALDAEEGVAHSCRMPSVPPTR